MLRLLLDVLPYDPDQHERVIREYQPLVNDTVDTLKAVGQQVNDGISAGGGGSHSTPYILGAILAALIALGLLLLMVRSYRRRGDQQLGFTRS
ncbi:MAG: hypothetical protein K5683_02010 [Prevotella sp.]|nr:hypothetical protein [Prevotella sp.]